MRFQFSSKCFVALSVRIAIALCALLSLNPRAVQAITITIDYTFDTGANAPKFFGVGNPGGAAAGAQAKAALEAAAGYYSTILTDTFSAIQAPANFTSTKGGTATFSWSPTVRSPLTGDTVPAPLQSVALNEYRIFASARGLSGGTVGVGGFGAGGYEYAVSSSNGFNPGEYNAQVQKVNAFETAVTTRGQTSGFVAWGGSITFDNDGSTNWHYDHSTAPAAGKSDFYSVAIHELGHALGLGISEEWLMKGTGPNFTGSNATSVYNGNPPLSAPEHGGHWKSGTMSKVFGTSIVQEAAMDPEINNGTRKYLTALDAAALKDIGWSVPVAVPPAPTYNPADFNKDTFVNAADLTQWKSAFSLNANGDANGDANTDGADFLVWQRNFGATSALAAAITIPEPAATAMLPLALAARGLARSRRPR